MDTVFQLTFNLLSVLFILTDSHKGTNKHIMISYPVSLFSDTHCAVCVNLALLVIEEELKRSCAVVCLRVLLFHLQCASVPLTH